MKTLSICLYIVLFGLVGLNLALLIVNTPMSYTYPSGYTIVFYTSLINAHAIMYAYTMLFVLLALFYYGVKYNII